VTVGPEMATTAPARDSNKEIREKIMVRQVMRGLYKLTCKNYMDTTSRLERQIIFIHGEHTVGEEE